MNCHAAQIDKKFPEENCSLKRNTELLQITRMSLPMICKARVLKHWFPPSPPENTTIARILNLLLMFCRWFFLGVSIAAHYKARFLINLCLIEFNRKSIICEMRFKKIRWFWVNLMDFFHIHVCGIRILSRKFQLIWSDRDKHTTTNAHWNEKQYWEHSDWKSTLQGAMNK